MDMEACERALEAMEDLTARLTENGEGEDEDSCAVSDELDASLTIERRILKHCRTFILERCGELNKLNERIFLLKVAGLFPDDYGDQFVSSQWTMRPKSSSYDLMRETTVKDGSILVDYFEHKLSDVKEKNSYNAVLNFNLGVAFQRAAVGKERDRILIGAIRDKAGGIYGGIIFEIKYRGRTLRRFFFSNSFFMAYIFKHNELSSCKKGAPKKSFAAKRCEICNSYHRFEWWEWLDLHRNFREGPGAYKPLPREKRFQEKQFTFMMPSSLERACSLLTDNEWSSLVAVRFNHQCSHPFGVCLEQARKGLLPEWQAQMIFREAKRREKTASAASASASKD